MNAGNLAKARNTRQLVVSSFPAMTEWVIHRAQEARLTDLRTAWLAYGLALECQAVLERCPKLVAADLVEEIALLAKSTREGLRRTESRLLEWFKATEEERATMIMEAEGQE
jgi:hypothetical protein